MNRRFILENGAIAELNNPANPWAGRDFAYLGTISFPPRAMSDGYTIGWAWHHDGRSIDRADRAFDLIDFPPPPPTYHHWLGADG